jgi:hypothetical protein
MGLAMLVGRSDPKGAPLDPSRISKLGLMLSRCDNSAAPYVFGLRLTLMASFQQGLSVEGCSAIASRRQYTPATV